MFSLQIPMLYPVTQNFLNWAVLHTGHDACSLGSVAFDLEHLAFEWTPEPDLCTNAGHFPVAKAFWVLGLLSSIFLCFVFLLRFALVKTKNI